MNTPNKSFILRLMSTFFILAYLLINIALPGHANDFYETYSIIPIEVDSSIYNLEAKIYRPGDTAAHPLIIINHGRSLGEEKKRPDLIEFYRNEAVALVGKGFVVVVPARRGYGNSGGKDAEQNFIYASANEGAKDIVEIVKYMQEQPYVNRNKVILMGQSAGGLVSVAAATKNISGLVGVINFSGGLRQLNSPTGSSDLAAVFGLLGMLSNKVPMVWIYCENDSVFPPNYAALAYNAFKSNGGQAKYYLLPPYGTDGHAFFGGRATIDIWMPIVEGFFDSIGENPNGLVKKGITNM